MIYLDADDLWHPDKIRKQVDRLLSDDRLLAVGTGIRLLMGDRDVDWPGRSDEVTHEHLLHNRVKELHSSTLAMKRIAFAKAGETSDRPRAASPSRIAFIGPKILISSPAPPRTRQAAWR